MWWPAATGEHPRAHEAEVERARVAGAAAVALGAGLRCFKRRWALPREMGCARQSTAQQQNDGPARAVLDKRSPAVRLVRALLAEASARLWCKLGEMAGQTWEQGGHVRRLAKARSGPQSKALPACPGTLERRAAGCPSSQSPTLQHRMDRLHHWPGTTGAAAVAAGGGDGEGARGEDPPTGWRGCHASPIVQITLL